jgi:hypothetical protein
MVCLCFAQESSPRIKSLALWFRPERFCGLRDLRQVCRWRRLFRDLAQTAENGASWAPRLVRFLRKNDPYQHPRFGEAALLSPLPVPQIVEFFVDCDFNRRIRSFAAATPWPWMVPLLAEHRPKGGPAVDLPHFLAAPAELRRSSTPKAARQSHTHC